MCPGRDWNWASHEYESNVPLPHERDRYIADSLDVKTWATGSPVTCFQETGDPSPGPQGPGEICHRDFRCCLYVSEN